MLKNSFGYHSAVVSLKLQRHWKNPRNSKELSHLNLHFSANHMVASVTIDFNDWKKNLKNNGKSAIYI